MLSVLTLDNGYDDTQQRQSVEQASVPKTAPLLKEKKKDCAKNQWTVSFLNARHVCECDKDSFDIYIKLS